MSRRIGGVRRDRGRQVGVACIEGAKMRSGWSSRNGLGGRGAERVWPGLSSRFGLEGVGRSSRRG